MNKRRKTRTSGRPTVTAQAAAGEALLQVAGRIGEGRHNAGAEELEHAASLAILRRHLFSVLHLWGYADRSLGDPSGDDPAVAGDWWRFCTRAGCPLLEEELDPPADGGPDPCEAVAMAASLDPACDLGELYQGLRETSLGRTKTGRLTLRGGRTARRRAGLFYTPDWMASRLSALLLTPWPATGGRVPTVLDPACGSGKLLVACLERVVDHEQTAVDERPAVIRELIPAMLRGIDTDRVSVALTRTALWMLADPRRGPVEGLDEAIVAGDSLVGSVRGKQGGVRSGVSWKSLFPAGTEAGAEGFDLVIANPPFEILKGYARRRGLKRYVERIRNSGYQLALRGNLNTSRLFLERALQVLAPRGRLAFVLPFGFVMDRVAAPLRTHLLHNGWLRCLEYYPESARAFYDVGQSVVLLTAGKDALDTEGLQVRDGTGRSPAGRVRLEQIEALDAESLPIPCVPVDALSTAARMHTANPARFEELATGRVGEVDQTFFRAHMRSQQADALLVRGAHLGPYRVDLGTADAHERWLDPAGFERDKGGGAWREHLEVPRVVQTGIVNMEAGRRLVAAEVPAGVFLGNSVNYWVAHERAGWDPELLRGYLLGLLNTTPLEWRFRVTSSNNNINLYEIRTLPVPRLSEAFPADSIPGFLEQAEGILRASRTSVLATVREVTSGWGTPRRDDRAVAMLIGRMARLRERESDARFAGRLDALLDHLVNWHLGMDEPDLERMFQDIPARRFREDT